jgi:Rps23 Pro-64 3,4-dihydroxylase Tpa1-like proline 4-hydroxylase
MRLQKIIILFLANFLLLAIASYTDDKFFEKSKDVICDDRGNKILVMDYLNDDSKKQYGGQFFLYHIFSFSHTD